MSRTGIATIIGGTLIASIAVCLLLFSGHDIPPAHSTGVNQLSTRQNGGQAQTTPPDGKLQTGPQAEQSNQAARAKNLVEKVRVSIREGKTPRKYAKFAAELAFLINEHADDEDLMNYLTSIVSGDTDSKVRAVVAIPFGMAGGKRAKSTLADLLFAEKDYKVALPLLLSLRISNPLREEHLSERLKRRRSFSGPVTLDVLSDVTVQMLASSELFYGNRTALAEDFSISNSDAYPLGGQTVVDVDITLASQFISLSEWDTFVARKFLEYFSLPNQPYDAINRATHILSSPAELPEEIIQSLVHMCTTKGMVEGIQFDQLSTALGNRFSEDSYFAREWRSVTQELLSAPVKPYGYVVSKLIETHLATPSNYYEAKELIKAYSSGTSNIRQINDILQQLDDRILAFPETTNETQNLSIIQREILQQYRQRDLSKFVRALYSLNNPVDGFAVQEAKQLLMSKAITDDLQRAILYNILGRFGNREDLASIESIAETGEKSKDGKAYAISEILKKN